MDAEGYQDGDSSYSILTLNSQSGEFMTVNQLTLLQASQSQQSEEGQILLVPSTCSSDTQQCSEKETVDAVEFKKQLQRLWDIDVDEKGQSTPDESASNSVEGINASDPVGEVVVEFSNSVEVATVECKVEPPDIDSVEELANEEEALPQHLDTIGDSGSRVSVMMRTTGLLKIEVDDPLYPVPCVDANEPDVMDTSPSNIVVFQALKEESSENSSSDLEEGMTEENVADQLLNSKYLSVKARKHDQSPSAEGSGRPRGRPKGKTLTNSQGKIKLALTLKCSSSSKGIGLRKGTRKTTKLTSKASKSCNKKRVHRGDIRKSTERKTRKSNLKVLVGKKSVKRGKLSQCSKRKIKRKISDLSESPDTKNMAKENSQRASKRVKNELQNEESTEVIDEIEGSRPTSQSEDKKHPTPQKQIQKCIYCDEIFPDKASLVLHKLIHSEEKPFVCLECKQSFRQKNQLVVHRRRHTNERPYLCDQCGKTFMTSHHLAVHRRSHFSESLPSCDECKKVFATDYGLEQHKKYHLLETVFKCDNCPRTFKRECFLKKHIEGRHCKTEAKRTFDCNICGKVYCRRSSLSSHMTAHGEGVAKHRCDYCGKRFYKKDHLNAHLLGHTGEKPFQCETCSKSYKTRNQLNVHERYHTGERPYECDICSKGFVSSSDVKRHRRVHTGEKPFECKQCGRSFRQVGNFSQHKCVSDEKKEYRVNYE